MQREGTTTIKSLAEPMIVFSLVAEEKMKTYIQKMGSTEIGWLGFVEKMDDEMYYVSDVFIPFQDVNGGTCELREEEMNTQMFSLIMEDENKYNQIRLWGHSHHTMAVSPSAQDDAQFQKFIDRWQNEPINPFFIRLIANNKGVVRVDLYDNVTKLRFDNLPTFTERIFDTEFYNAIDAEIKANTRTITYSAKNTQQNFSKGTTGMMVSTSGGGATIGKVLDTPQWLSVPEKKAIISQLVTDVNIHKLFDSFQSYGNLFTSSIIDSKTKLSNIGFLSDVSTQEAYKIYKDFVFDYGSALYQDFHVDLEQMMYELCDEIVINDIPTITKAQQLDAILCVMSDSVYDMLTIAVANMGIKLFEGDAAEVFLEAPIGKLTQLLMMCEAIYNNADIVAEWGFSKKAFTSALTKHIENYEYPLLSNLLFEFVSTTTSVIPTLDNKKKSKKQAGGN